LRARNRARAVTVPLRAFPLRGDVRVMEFRPGGDLLLLLTEARLFVRDWREDKYLSWGDEVHDVGAACWGPDGRWLAIGYHSGDVHVRAVPDGKLLHQMKLTGAITALAPGPDGQRLAVAATVVKDWQNSATVLPWILHDRMLTRVGETAVRVWDVPSRTFLPGDWKHPQPVHCMAFNRAGTRLITTGMDRKARV